MTRRREPLESYPLDSVIMVGTLKKPGATYAILQVDKAVFQAKAGNYVGQDFGQITAVTDTEVNITERVQDASDEWVERKTTLELQETKK
jgi:type IV pilus assembly protein PilP